MSVKSACGIDINHVRDLELNDELKTLGKYRCNGCILMYKYQYTL